MRSHCEYQYIKKYKGEGWAKLGIINKYLLFSIAIKRNSEHHF